MLHVRIFLTILLLTLIFTIKHSHGEVINIQGEMTSDVTAYITKRITSYSGAKNLKAKLYLPSTYSRGLYTQTITGLYKNFLPSPTDIREFTDEFGNQGVELVWKKDVKLVQLDLQFNAKIYSNFYPILSNAPFPAVYQEAIQSTELSPAHDFLINYIGRTLSKDLYREIDVVTSVLIWLDRNIELQGSNENNSSNDALTVLKMRRGTDEGVCNLLSSILKGLGIPAQVAYGLSFQQEIQIDTPDESILYDLPNNERFWVEIFFPDIGWASYDPHGMWLGMMPHVIKLSHGPDSSYAKESLTVEDGEIEVFKEYIFDIKSDTQKITFDGYGELNIDKLVVSPPVDEIAGYTEEPNLDIEALKLSDQALPLPPGEKGIFLEYSDLSKRLDIIATKNRVYAQRFTVNYPVTVNEIRLPLIKFSDDGKIWVEVYSDNDGRPYQKLFRTYSIRSAVVRHMMEENPWLTFPIGKKTDSYLVEGEYWLALRSSGNCIFNWYAYEGNVVGGSTDTRFMDVTLKNPHWNNIVNFDVHYQLIGTRATE
ncbi:MAG: transglutaminase domain-containing protein [Spirochaetota bacterium]|nr:MAG: transglutaminase domain-containing protein [Spirochaetota bacterium]